MSSHPVDPSGNTQAFRAFTEQPEPVAAAPRTPWLVIGGALAAVVAIVLLAWLALG